MIIPEGVFNPIFTLSTDLIISVLEELGVKGNVLDYGCGSGIIAIYIAKRFNNVKVLAYDLSPKALITTRYNILINGVEGKVRIIHRDELRYFKGMLDYVVSNPPYLPLEPIDELDLNWCSGRYLSIIKQVILESKKLLRSNGTLVISSSSLTPLHEVLKFLARCGFRIIMMKKKFVIF